jgi:inner membrane protein
MFLAHLPAGYLCGLGLGKCFAAAALPARPIMLAALAGALAPDLDLLYFFLVDHGRSHHHLYWPHYPLLWLALGASTLAWYGTAKHKLAPASAFVFSVAALIHAALDTVVGDIHWLAPFVYQPYSLFTVPARYQPWWLNFLLHWSMAFELMVVALAASLYWRRRRRARCAGP